MYIMKRRYKKKRGWKKFRRWTTWGMSNAAKALIIAKSVKSMMNVEFKRRDTNTSTNIDSDGFLQPLSLIAQGDEDTNRNGNSVKLKSIQYRGKVARNPAGSTTQTLRMILFIDKLNGAPGVTEPLVSDAPYGVLANPSTISQVRFENRKRYTILKDRTFQVNDESKQTVVLKYYKKMNMKIEFKDDTTLNALYNNLWLLLISDSAENGPSWDSEARIRFLDN